MSERSRLSALYDEATERYREKAGLGSCESDGSDAREWFKIRVSIAAALDRGDKAAASGKGGSRKGPTEELLADFPDVA